MINSLVYIHCPHHTSIVTSAVLSDPYLPVYRIEPIFEFLERSLPKNIYTLSQNDLRKQYLNKL